MSGAEATNSSGAAIVAAFSSRRRRADSLRSRSVSRREPTRISQPRGLSGTPSVGHCWAAASKRLLHSLLGQVEVPVVPTSALSTCGVCSRSRSSKSLTSPARTLSITGRTSTATYFASGIRAA